MQTWKTVIMGMGREVVGPRPGDAESCGWFSLIQGSLSVDAKLVGGSSHYLCGSLLPTVSSC